MAAADTAITEAAAPSHPAGILRAILLQRCPSCRSAPVFCGWIGMREACGRCGYRFEREPGYFVGAMYLSYVLAVPTYTLLVLGAEELWPGRSSWFAIGAALPPLLPMAPLFFRYSRILWMHLDRAVDPPE